MESFGRNGHLRQACSLPRMHTDSCQVCSRTPGCTAAARCTRPHLEAGRTKMCDRIFTGTPVVVQVNVHLRAYPFGIGGPSSRADRHKGWVVRRCLHSRMVLHTQLRGVFGWSLIF